MTEPEATPPALPERAKRRSKSPVSSIIVDVETEDFGDLEDMPLPPLPDVAPSLNRKKNKEESLYITKHETLSGGAVFAQKNATLEEINKGYRSNEAAMNALIKCQAIARGFLVRHRMLVIPSENLAAKIKLFSAFFKKEVEFQAKMKTFDVSYMQEIANSKFTHFDYEEFHVIKNYIDFIYNLQKKIMAIFIQIKRDGYPFYFGIGKIVDFIKEDFQKYGSYLDNARTFYATFQKWKRKSSDFEEFLDIKQLNESPGSLEKYLTLPVHHIAGYLHYVDQIRKVTPHFIPEYMRLENSVSYLKLIQEYIERGSNRNFNPHYCYILDQQLGNTYSKLYPENRARTHICDFESKKVHKNKKETVKIIAVLSDKVLVLKEKTNKKTGALYEIEDSFSTDLMCASTKKDNEYKITFKDKKSLIYYLSPEDEERVTPLINKVIIRNNSDKVPFFGGNLSEIYEKYGGKEEVPQIIIDICTYLMKFSEFENLFHLTNSSSSVELINAIKSNPNYMLLASRDDCYQVVLLLHYFLKNLGQTLFPQNLYTSFIKLDMVPDDDDFVEEAERILTKLPRVNFKTLCYIISFFVSFLSKSKKNVFKLNALGIIFGPALIAPPKELENDPEVIKNVTKINSVCARMMDQAYRLKIIIGMPF